MTNRGGQFGPGLILQRGGEELLLSRVGDRFTTRLTAPTSLDELRSLITPLAVRPVAQGQLVEWQVNPERLEDALTAARQSARVQFASRVYRLVASPRTWIYLTDQITVQFAPTVMAAQRQAIVAPLGLAISQTLAGIPNTFVYRVTSQASENPLKIANRLMRLTEVLTAEPNVVMATAPQYRPTDPLFRQQWHLTSVVSALVKPNAHISAEAAWDLTRGTRSIVVAVCDDGFDLTHPDLQGLGKIVAPKDLKAQDAVPLPDGTTDNHGTACAGLAIGEENASGIVGVAPGCGLMPIRMTGFLDDTAIEDMFRWAVQQGAAVISCSWSPAAIKYPLSLRQRLALTQAATQGRDGKGCVIVFSAGNANRPVHGTVTERDWPRNAVRGRTEWLSGFAVHPDVITVSACTSLNGKSAYSNWGRDVAVAAPSNNGHPTVSLPETGSIKTGPPITTATPGRGMVTSDRTGTAGYDRDAYTNTFGGTSSACPEVAGVAALVLSANPSLTAREVKQILQQTADKITDTTPDPQLGTRYGTYDQQGHSQWFGYGRVNAYRAVREAKRRLWQGRTYTRMVEIKDEVTTPIPDNQPLGITRTQPVRTPGIVQDLIVHVTLQHDYLGDIEVSLQLPSGQALLLQGRTLGNQQQLDDHYTVQNTPILIEAIGSAATGEWGLRVSDRAPGHTGQLLSWHLTLAVQ
ncbi:S8 family serine peptidase [Leptolyngbya iicbica]|uniref:Peptidase S8 n=2 Tax=Cyanophyceae TaxID=3028117 RepID=A0A4Q7E0I1_9CYAN|nr:S8 family serine peptidase [Leptolyngbya sp. LK]RZM74854.1 peptidase S8 [Leptolyngbya sp. LK]